MTYTKQTLAKRKQNKNGTRKTQPKIKIQMRGDTNTIWNNYGHVLNPKTNKYVRLGSSESMRVINELEHNEEWRQRVDYIIQNHSTFGKKLENYLRKKQAH